MSDGRIERAWNEGRIWQVMDEQNHQLVRCAGSGTVIGEIALTHAGTIGIAFAHDRAQNRWTAFASDWRDVVGQRLPCPHHDHGHIFPDSVSPRIGRRALRIN